MKALVLGLFLAGFVAPQLRAAEVRSDKPVIPEKAEVLKNRSAFATTERAPEKPVRIEQDCPAPDPSDAFRGSTWNSIEVGISFPLGVSAPDFKPYTRYTCPAPRPGQ